MIEEAHFVLRNTSAKQKRPLVPWLHELRPLVVFGRTRFFVNMSAIFSSAAMYFATYSRDQTLTFLWKLDVDVFYPSHNGSGEGTQDINHVAV